MARAGAPPGVAQAAALDADTMDPLGLGRIETRTMQLLPADKAPKISRLQRYGSVTAQVGIATPVSRPATSAPVLIHFPESGALPATIW